MNSLTRSKILLILSIISSLSILVTILNFNNSMFITFLIASFISTSLLTIAIKDAKQTKHSLLRNYPLIARLRWVFEQERSKINQYFIESDTDGTPYNREVRSDIYQKAKKELNTTPFGTKLNVYENGYEFIKHSMYPKDINSIKEPRVNIGSDLCKQPYNASILNVSAMSYGALSDAAIRAINGGAKLGNFYQNTGEGGLSPFHLENGGDLCFQIGTGYFGAGQTIDGKRYFNSEAFKANALRPEVKMIEIKLSQGSKPGLGGILPASKNSKEIAEIRGIEPGIDVVSPPYHTSFDSPESMLGFIKMLRILSEYKPVGIKMCLGDEEEVSTLISTMRKLGVYPDFITIDGSEGGTGAAPIVFTNSVGTPLVDSLVFIDKKLKDNGLRDKIKIIASGKVSNSFDIIKMISLGADLVNAARSFMFSLGCIQARECNKNTCPVGIATQDPSLIKGLNPAEKKVRVFNYHSGVIHELREVMSSMGILDVNELKPELIKVRVDKNKIISYKELYQL